MKKEPWKGHRDDDRIPEPWFAALPGSEWDENAMRAMSDLLQQELLPRWRRQVLAGGAKADRADDILHDFTVELYRSLIPQYQPHPEGTRLIGYLCQFFAWRLRDAIRSQYRREQRETDPVDDSRELGQVVHIDAGKQALLVALKKALQQLPERPRRVMEMRKEGWSYAEIGLALGIKEGHARTAAFHARKDLKTLLEKGAAHD